LARGGRELAARHGKSAGEGRTVAACAGEKRAGDDATAGVWRRNGGAREGGGEPKLGLPNGVFLLGLPILNRVRRSSAFLLFPS
jgi:hypothetical protein